jgi:hypothetical protein
MSKANPLEADWEIEIGGESPVIDSGWAGFVDLRVAPEKASQLPELQQLPELGAALLRLNAVASPFFTAKCDVWRLESIDPLEFDADFESTAHALACYLDLLPCDPLSWTETAGPTAWCKQLCMNLRASGPRCSRADLILRSATGSAGQSAYGVTAYVAACGSTEKAAKMKLAAALAVFVDAVETVGSHSAESSKLQ